MEKNQELKELMKKSDKLTGDIRQIGQDILKVGKEIKTLVVSRNSVMNELLEDNPFETQIRQWMQNKKRYIKALPKVSNDKYYNDEVDIILDYLDMMLVTFNYKGKKKDFSKIKMFSPYSCFEQSLFSLSENVKNDFDSEFANFFHKKVEHVVSIFPKP